MSLYDLAMDEYNRPYSRRRQEDELERERYRLDPHQLYSRPLSPGQEALLLISSLYNLSLSATYRSQGTEKSKSSGAKTQSAGASAVQRKAA